MLKQDFTGKEKNKMKSMKQTSQEYSSLNNLFLKIHAELL